MASKSILLNKFRRLTANNIPEVFPGLAFNLCTIIADNDKCLCRIGNTKTATVKPLKNFALYSRHAL